MVEPTQHEVTQLLQRWRAGDGDALDALLPLVYRELRAVAQNYLNRERPGHTLQGTALVHELYERLTHQTLPEWRNRAHFFAVAAQIMRQILVDHARARNSSKRGGDATRVSIAELEQLAMPDALDLLALDDALARLTALDPQQGRVVDLKVFVGLTNDETAEVLGVSVATVKRDWETARVWLYRELSGVADR